jgi:hypothetical protein
MKALPQATCISGRGSKADWTIAGHKGVYRRICGRLTAMDKVMGTQARHSGGISWFYKLSGEPGKDKGGDENMQGTLT